MRKWLGSFVEAEGLWEPAYGSIIVKRSVLRVHESYTGTLLHEMAHAIGGSGSVN
jgi:hypothetical protein